MADVENVETGSQHKEDREKTIEEAQKHDDTSAAEVASALSNDSTLNARAQLANLISLVHSIESSTGEPDHKKVVYEVFGTVFEQNTFILALYRNDNFDFKSQSCV
jgi:hypothetical protein